MKWVTRERPKIDRIACPWLIARFIDKAPEFLYVPAASVLRVAQDTGAIPCDVPGVEMTRQHGPRTLRGTKTRLLQAVLASGVLSPIP